VIGPAGEDRWAAAAVLGAAGLEVAEETEAEILAAVDQMAPMLVVLDDSRGRAARDAAQARLQAHPALQGVPLIVLAYDSDIDSYSGSITQGAAAYLVKPFDPEELADAARRLSGWKSRGDSTEKRRRMRRPLLMKVDVELRRDKRRFPGQLLDASGGGCRVEVPEEVAAGELVRVILHTHEDSTHVALGAEVRWHVVSAGGAHEVGLRFTGSTAALAGQLLGFASSST
jgi:twitching motility two-component system response regulator PilH